LAGVILLVGLLIAPAIAARQWTHKLNQMVILAAVFGAFAGGTGAVISAIDSDIPTGPMIIVVAFIVVMLSIGFAPGRGLIWTWLRQRDDSRRFATQNALRDLFKYATDHGGANSAVPDSFIRGIGNSSVLLGLEQLRQQGHANSTNNQWTLTKTGIKMAQHDAHNQKLWEMYRIYGDELGLPIVREDRQLIISDVLSDDAVQKLELKLEK